MRMAGPDVVLFIVGALLFGGALTAIIVTQGPGAFTGTAGSPSGLYSVTWTTASGTPKSLQVSDFTGGSVKGSVNGTNVDKVTVSVTCSDPASAAVPFAISVNVDGPNNLKGKGSGNCGDKIEVVVKVQDVPGPTSASGSTPEAAASSLPANPNATAGVGDWTITFSGSRGPTGALPVPAPGPSGTISLVAETFSPKLDPVAK